MFAYVSGRPWPLGHSPGSSLVPGHTVPGRAARLELPRVPRPCCHGWRRSQSGPGSGGPGGSPGVAAGGPDGAWGPAGPSLSTQAPCHQDLGEGSPGDEGHVLGTCSTSAIPRCDQPRCPHSARGLGGGWGPWGASLWWRANRDVGLGCTGRGGVGRTYHDLPVGSRFGAPLYPHDLTGFAQQPFQVGNLRNCDYR